MPSTGAPSGTACGWTRCRRWPRRPRARRGRWRRRWRGAELRGGSRAERARAAVCIGRPAFRKETNRLMTTIQLYDATLRDGMQGEGLTLSAHEKVRVVRKLDELGIHLIEAGFPASNPKELEVFELLADERLETAQIAAFGMTRRRDVPADEDAALRVLADCFASVCTIVGKTWGLHLEKVVRVGRDENLAMIADSVAFLAAAGKRVIYDAEHFFDGFRADSGYARACLEAAAEAGAETLSLCDTNGSSLPSQIAEATRMVVAEFGPRARIGIHPHDDSGCGV